MTHLKYFNRLKTSVNFVRFNSVVLTLTLGCFLTCSSVSAASNPVVISESLQKELILTQREKTVFDKFKSAVYRNLTMDFLKQDLFLLRWIRGKDLDLDRSKRDMFTFLAFIEENRIATILEEDWSDIRVDFPYTTNITDREGRPVGFGSIAGGYWNIRRGMLQGKRSRLMRYTYMMIFELNQRLVDIGKSHPNVTQFTFVLDLNGFNPIQHSCPLCVSTYITMLDSYERFLPGYTHEIIAINAPQAYLGLIDVTRPFLSKNTREALKVFGPNRNKWGPYLDSTIGIKKFPDLD